MSGVQDLPGSPAAISLEEEDAHANGKKNPSVYSFAEDPPVPVALAAPAINQVKKEPRLYLFLRKCPSLKVYNVYCCV